MITVEKSITINKPVAEVFAYVTNGDHSTKWQIGLEATEQEEGSAANTVGSRYTEVRKFLGQEMRTTLELTAFETNAKWAAKVVKGPVLYEITTTFKSADGDTKMTTRIEGEPTGFFKVAQGMVNAQLGKNLEESGQKLKELLEAA